MDVQTRKLRSFVALAEELHFSRAAARLFIAQQALSKQIRELEAELGVQLVTRTTRLVELTPAGEAFLAGARDALAGLDAGVQAAHRASRGETQTLRIGFGIGAALELTGPILATFRERHANVTVELREYGVDEPSAGLADGWADAALIRPPVTVADLELRTLFAEPRTVVLAANHPLAGREVVHAEDLRGESFAVGACDDRDYLTFWSLGDYLAGSARPTIIPTKSHTEEIELVAAGIACTISVAAAIRYTPHPGVRHIPLADVPPSAVAVAWRRSRRTPAVDAFVAVAEEVRDRELDVVAAIEHPFT